MDRERPMSDLRPQPASGQAAGRDASQGRPARLEMSQLSLAIDGRRILSGLDAAIDFTRLGVLGRNGSGKSTLARVIAGLIAPDDGQITLNGKDMARDRRAAILEVGILFQNPDHQIIFPTVQEELAFGLTQQGQGKRQAQENALAILARFGKSHWAEAAVSTLSHGQKHLVCLMAVVAMQPRVIVLDEPFAGLDIPTRMQLRRALRQFPGASIHISHDPEDIADCDTCLWLDEGTLLRAGPGPEVTAAYLAAMEERGAGDDLSDLTR